MAGPGKVSSEGPIPPVKQVVAKPKKKKAPAKKKAAKK